MRDGRTKEILSSYHCRRRRPSTCTTSLFLPVFSIQDRKGREISNKVAFNTIDGFQRQEKDVIVLSCEGWTGAKSVGFLADVRRMNVALARAKSGVFIVGHVLTLERSDRFWTQIVADARERNCLVDTPGNSKALLFRRSLIRDANTIFSHYIDDSLAMLEPGSLF
ncbi:hypothetical protein ARMSODRAFT_218233 [Armillaria solidipes]|uniref:DNA2/NAM7 helicase-like C-terminal domain-containing protein n=1 Tax=Armillaria solidipes TaxID=1076256 RepID=A0A2H3CHI2_9AGAR|nr:hypothetical protein ARMSODRAFT_218233 [Armillaria solidipes]